MVTLTLEITRDKKWVLSSIQQYRYSKQGLLYLAQQQASLYVSVLLSRKCITRWDWCSVGQPGSSNSIATIWGRQNEAWWLNETHLSREKTVPPKDKVYPLPRKVQGEDIKHYLVLCGEQSTNKRCTTKERAHCAPEVHSGPKPELKPEKI